MGSIPKHTTPVDERYKVKDYYPTIGIECHVQLKTRTKLFTSVSNEAREADPNSLVSHVCFGMPGALPVLNAEAVRLASKAAYALGTKPQPFSTFDRKHYFYPDLPKGYQISQFDQPIILNGSITIQLDDGSEKVINITRAHMEEDAGKSTHPAGADYSLVDLNRAGTPLLEIVSEPEIHNAQEAKAYAKELWLRMKYADVSDVDLYHGNMRFDVNVSVSKDSLAMGTRSETKNLNSFRSVERAVEYEIKRQIDLLESGGEVVQETRGWLDDKQKTLSQRSKEDAHDYRYFPDPDIPPIVLDDAYLSDIEQDLPAMPDTWRAKLDTLGLEKSQIEVLLEAQAEDPTMRYLEHIELNMNREGFPKQLVNWLVNVTIPLKREGTYSTLKHGLEATRMYLDLFELVDAGALSSTNAKKIIADCIVHDTYPDNLESFAQDKGYIQMSDSGELEKIVEKVLADNPKPVEDIKSGEMKVIGFLVGQVMKASQGKANPGVAQQIIRDKLDV